MITELTTQYDTRKSFYGKAKIEYHKNTKEELILSLYSYNTLVAYINTALNKAVVIATHSNTTLRHIKEFLLQNGFKAENKRQILKDYPKVL